MFASGGISIYSVIIAQSLRLLLGLLFYVGIPTFLAKILYDKETAKKVSVVTAIAVIIIQVAAVIASLFF